MRTHASCRVASDSLHARSMAQPWRPTAVPRSHRVFALPF
ncbi:hypothetical protein HMPREF0762_01309 [Slackia exigua ATCC 700122]|uniref:Uncharacterized protein n=1 Tax=Slackia exigua (strain ATCC 700122 / DSM 15923 / CIP 105133 / JCM 11022 / KCTC 5966 / S-7) TaxID=649764 RepID=D0WH40_SLAES|nr:hypothetical protein HMPREF0762_01309 [Slackia exigua ATCC 700122]